MKPTLSKWLILVGSAILTVLLTGCQSIQYYSQAVSGHLSILAKQRNIDEIIKDARVDEKTRAQLKQILAHRAFAIDTLKLPENKSYTRYADLGRPYAVWNVVAAPEFSVEPVTSCFPIVGCLSYVGYYAKQDALDKAQHLKEQGLDVHVGGVSAYSTLGWFPDPVLNTMLARSEASMAALIFHELAHQVLYIKGDTKFNESFATAVESIGLRKWAEIQENTDAIDAYFDSKAKRSQVIALVLAARKRMQAAYQKEQDKTKLVEIKRNQFALLKAEYQLLKQEGGGTKGYDQFFDSDLNHASLALFGEYHGWLRAFEQLYKNSDSNWARFYQEVKRLGALPKTKRNAQLEALNAAN